MMTALMTCSRAMPVGKPARPKYASGVCRMCSISKMTAKFQKERCVSLACRPVSPPPFKQQESVTLRVTACRVTFNFGRAPSGIWPAFGHERSLPGPGWGCEHYVLNVWSILDMGQALRYIFLKLHFEGYGRPKVPWLHPRLMHFMFVL